MIHLLNFSLKIISTLILCMIYVLLIIISLLMWDRFYADSIDLYIDKLWYNKRRL